MFRSDKRPCKYVVKNAQIVRKSKKLSKRAKNALECLT